MNSADAFRRRGIGRRPRQELSGLVDSYVSDEILYREGKTLGLDRDDAVIKRRVRQKLEVMAEEAGARAAPTDAELTAYLNAHPEKFARAALVSFEQLYFDPAKPGVESRIKAANAALSAGDAPDALGDSTMLPYRIDGEGIDAVVREFGSDFAAALTDGAAGSVDRACPLRTRRAPGPRHVMDSTRRPRRSTPCGRKCNASGNTSVASVHFDASYAAMRAKYDVTIEAPLAGAGVQ